MIDPLTPEELAALAAIDGSMRQARPSPELESRLRALGLIENSRHGGLPVRTRAGEARLKMGEEQSRRGADR